MLLNSLIGLRTFLFTVSNLMDLVCFQQWSFLPIFLSAQGRGILLTRSDTSRFAARLYLDHKGVAAMGNIQCDLQQYTFPRLSYIRLSDFRGLLFCTCTLDAEISVRSTPAS